MDGFLGFSDDIVLTGDNSHGPSLVKIDQGRPVAVIKNSLEIGCQDLPPLQCRRVLSTLK